MILGITYKGVQTRLNRLVAIKELFMKDYCERDNENGYVTASITGDRREFVGCV